MISRTTNLLRKPVHLPIIADSFRSLEEGFTVFGLGDELKKKDFDLKENEKLKYLRFKLCLLASIISIKTI